MHNAMAVVNDGRKSMQGSVAWGGGNRYGLSRMNE